MKWKLKLLRTAKKIAKLKATARLKRAVTAIPVVGIGAAGYFEESERREWLASNPGKTNADYACEIAELTSEVLDKVVSELPMNVKLPSWAIPDCIK